MTSAEPARHGAAPTLELREASVRSAGTVSAVLSLRSHSQRIGLVGDVEPWLGVLTQRTLIASGQAHIFGSDLETAITKGVLGFAACDPPLPDSFNVTQYLQHAARLSHGSASRAVLDAKQALDRYGLAGLGSLESSRLVPYQRRALGIALATLTSPPVVWLEAPLRGLDAPSAAYVARLCAEAAQHCRVIISAARPSSPSPERALLDACDELFVLENGVLVAQGSPAQVFAPNGRYLLTVKGENRAAFSSALNEAGCRVTARDPIGNYLIELPTNGSSDLLLDTALDHGLIVIELEPIFGAG